MPAQVSSNKPNAPKAGVRTTTPARTGTPKWLIPAVIGVAVVVAIVVALLSSGSDDKPTALTPGTGSGVQATLPGAAAVEELLGGIPQSGLTLGNPDAKVTIKEYLDIQCPFCARAANGYVRDVIKNYVRTGTATLIARPMTFLGDDSVKGAQAILAAGNQNRAWQLLEVLYANQGTERSGWLNDTALNMIAATAGLDVAKMNTERVGADIVAEVPKVATEAAAAGVDSTPTFVVNGPNGQVVVTGADYGKLSSAIDQVK